MPWWGHGAGPSSARRSALQEGQNGCGELGGVVFLYEVPGVGDDLKACVGECGRASSRPRATGIHVRADPDRR
jgi:hypothetical protein